MQCKLEKVFQRYNRWGVVLKRELKKTVDAVRLQMDGETTDSIVEGFKEVEAAN